MEGVLQLHISRAARGLIFLVSAAITGVFLINICSLVFQCGCGWIWGAAATHCNIHTPGVRHCPWCVHPTVYYASGGFIIAAQFAISFWPNRWPWVYRLAAALAAFPVLGVTLAGAYGLVSGYWS